eukprot:gnl/TRDRNA2_/TRDRNA2_189799_c0_seq1.p1 gnl/TRDRNA2_/TRDRNA2_189799_c0~~gnl/TRDRNA2_/TRDRNA2_189799_c0_seq1.p1  ORF type:complete len:179 (+),score=27.59 gnl/TRDRNA2_/TRDRNA2_189799_c0_seq1:65-601(+)
MRRLSLLRCASSASRAGAPFEPRYSSVVVEHNQNNDRRHCTEPPRGLVATRHLRAGETLLEWSGPTLESGDHWSLQSGPNEHLDLREHPLRCINHSCDPSVVMQGHRFTTRREVPMHEELTLDYNASEEELVGGTFACICGTPGCVGEVRGWRHLSVDQRKARSDRAAAWLMEKWKDE